jgi:hypothetical protein
MFVPAFWEEFAMPQTIPNNDQEAADGDCADPRREHFDATLLAWGEAVARLVNTTLRTPTAEQFRDLIRDKGASCGPIRRCMHKRVVRIVAQCEAVP